MTWTAKAGLCTIEQSNLISEPTAELMANKDMPLAAYVIANGVMQERTTSLDLNAAILAKNDMAIAGAPRLLGDNRRRGGARCERECV